MKIKMLTSLGGVDFSYAPGDVVDFPVKEAKRHIAAGHAEAVDAAPVRKAPAQATKARKGGVEKAVSK